MESVDVFQGLGKIGDEEKWCQFVLRVHADRSVSGTITATALREWRNAETHCVMNGCVRQIHAPGHYEVQFVAVALDPTLKDDEAMHWIARLAPASMTARYKYAASGREYQLDFFRTGKSHWVERLASPCVPLEPDNYRFSGYCATSKLVAKSALFLSLELKSDGALSGTACECTRQSRVERSAIMGTWKRDRMHFTAVSDGVECTFTATGTLSGLRGSWWSENRQCAVIQYESGDFEFTLCDRRVWCDSLRPKSPHGEEIAVL